MATFVATLRIARKPRAGRANNPNSNLDLVARVAVSILGEWRASLAPPIFRFISPQGLPGRAKILRYAEPCCSTTILARSAHSGSAGWFQVRGDLDASHLVVEDKAINRELRSDWLGPDYEFSVREDLGGRSACSRAAPDAFARRPARR